jgi:hypothetical protein
MKKLTQKRLKEVLDCNPDNGLFYWKSSEHNKSTDKPAGTKTNGYICIQIDRKLYRAPRLAFLYMEGYFPEYDVDHINRIRDDDRWINLRHVSRSCNVRNCDMLQNNTSGITGVCWNTRTGKWIVQLTINNERKWLGSFNDLSEAVQVRWEAEVKYGFPNCTTTSSAFQYLQENLEDVNE